MKRIAVAALAGLVAFAACSNPDQSPTAPIAPELSFGSSGTLRITNSNNAGPGSFRQAVLTANANPAIGRLEFAKHLSPVQLLEPVVFTGTQSLAIDGNRATIDGQGLGAGLSAFAATGGGNLEVKELTVRRAPGVGITVAVPGTATGTIKISLLGVKALSNGSHGVLINDQAEYFTDPNSTAPGGSAAGLEVVVLGSTFEANGFTGLDQDGLRINEGGLGTLKALVTTSRVEGNGGDGIEFDERDVGDISFSLIGTALHRNGGFFLTSAHENFEQGFDLNENDAGDLRVDRAFVSAVGNAEEGIEYEEDDDFAGGGDIIASLTAITVRDNGINDGDAGLKLREKGVGNLDVRLSGVESSNNPRSGIQLREDADGNLTARTQTTTTNTNAGDGVELDENGAGNLDAILRRATSSNNALAGVRADQGSAGTGALQLLTFVASGNGVAPIVANGVTVTLAP